MAPSVGFIRVPKAKQDDIPPFAGAGYAGEVVGPMSGVARSAAAVLGLTSDGTGASSGLRLRGLSTTFADGEEMFATPGGRGTSPRHSVSPFELCAFGRPASAPAEARQPTSGGELTSLLRSGLIPPLLKDQLQHLVPPAGVSRFRAASFPAPTSADHERLARLAYDIFGWAERTGREGGFREGKTAAQIYHPGRYELELDGYLPADFTIESTTFAIRNPDGHLDLIGSPKTATVANGSQKRVVSMWRLPLTKDGEREKVVLLMQPLTILEDDGSRTLCPSIEEECATIRRLKEKGGGDHLFIPDTYFTARLRDPDTGELTRYNCAVQEELPFLNVLPGTILDRLLAIRGAAMGLQELHRAGLTHRDVKPENMIGVVRAKEIYGGLADFGESGHWKRRSPSGKDVLVPYPIATLNFQYHAPETPNAYYMMRKEIDPSLELPERTIGLPALPPEVTAKIETLIPKLLKRFSEGPVSRRINRIHFYHGPKQDIAMLGAAALEILGGRIAPPEDPAETDKYKELREFLITLRDPDPKNRPNARTIVEKLTAFIRAEGDDPLLPPVEAGVEEGAAMEAAASSRSTPVLKEGSASLSE